MKTLFIAVHPDDETLGCGGTILKHVHQKDNAFWLIVTQAVKDSGFSKEFIEAREEQIEKVAHAYHFSDTYQLGYPTKKLHSVEFNDLLHSIATVIRKVEPDIVYTVNRSDVHTDHQITAKAVMGCTKTFRFPSIKRILMYEVLSETEVMSSLPESAFIPNVFSDISKFLEEKIRIMQIYESELQNAPLPRSIASITALAQYRGITVGVEYAEAFMLLRDLF